MFEFEEDRVTRCKAGFKGDTCDTRTLHFLSSPSKKEAKNGDCRMRAGRVGHGLRALLSLRWRWLHSGDWGVQGRRLQGLLERPQLSDQ